jgi:hypothetical protein
MVDVIHNLPRSQRRGFLLDALASVANDGRILCKDMPTSPRRVAWNAGHDLALTRELVHVEPIDNVVGWAGEVGFDIVHTRVVFRRSRVRSLRIQAAVVEVAVGAHTSCPGNIRGVLPHSTRTAKPQTLFKFKAKLN